MNGPKKDFKISLSSFFINCRCSYCCKFEPINMDTKINLSDQELQLAYNTDWILTKQKITASVYQLFGELSCSINEELMSAADWIPEEVIASIPKIHKGENYLQLPYVMLDHPRCFGKQDIFALRTLFWWGNFFSCTILLEGKYKKLFRSALTKNLIESDAEFHICINEDKWQHHFNNDNYCSVKSLGQDQIEKIIAEKEFIKIAVQYPLQKWHKISSLLKADIKKLLGLLKN